MARSRSRGSSTGGGGRAGSGRPAARKAAPAAPTQVEVVEEKQGMGVEDGIAIMTAVLLIAALLMLDYDMGKNFGEGMFFK